MITGGHTSDISGEMVTKIVCDVGCEVSGSMSCSAIYFRPEDQTTIFYTTIYHYVLSSDPHTHTHTGKTPGHTWRTNSSLTQWLHTDIYLREPQLCSRHAEVTVIYIILQVSSACVNREMVKLFLLLKITLYNLFSGERHHSDNNVEMCHVSCLSSLLLWNKSHLTNYSCSDL